MREDTTRSDGPAGSHDSAAPIASGGDWRAHRGIFLGFLGATVALFVAWYLRAEPSYYGEPADQIHLEAALADELRAEPDATYGTALLHAIADEIYVRDGVAMGLPRTDVVVRQRIIQQRMRGIVAQATIEPTDAQLESYFKDHAERYRVPARATFEQRFFRRTHDDELSEALQRIAERGEPGDASVGDAFVHGTRFSSMPSDEIRSLFGARFRAFLFEAPLGQWVGPVASGFGNHVVRVETREASRPASFEEAHAAVEGDWLEEQAVAAVRARLTALRDEYTVDVPARFPAEVSDGTR